MRHIGTITEQKQAERFVHFLASPRHCQLNAKNARLCSKERTIYGFVLSRTPVFSLLTHPQISSKERRLVAIFHKVTMPSGAPQQRLVWEYACSPHFLACVLLMHYPRMSPFAPTTSRGSNDVPKSSSVPTWMRYRPCKRR